MDTDSVRTYELAESESWRG